MLIENVALLSSEVDQHVPGNSRLRIKSASAQNSKKKCDVLSLQPLSRRHTSYRRVVFRCSERLAISATMRHKWSKNHPKSIRSRSPPNGFRILGYSWKASGLRFGCSRAASRFPFRLWLGGDIDLKLIPETAQAFWREKETRE